MNKVEKRNKFVREQLHFRHALKLFRYEIVEQQDRSITCTKCFWSGRVANVYAIGDDFGPGSQNGEMRWIPVHDYEKAEKLMSVRIYELFCPKCHLVLWSNSKT